MKKNKDLDETLDQEIESIKHLFLNDEEFFEALEDAKILNDLKNPTKYSIELEDLEEKILNLIPKTKKFTFQVLFANYKRYLCKHFITYLKEQENIVFNKGLNFGEELDKNKKDK